VLSRCRYDVVGMHVLNYNQYLLQGQHESLVGKSCSTDKMLTELHYFSLQNLLLAPQQMYVKGKNYYCAVLLCVINGLQ
jgi:hypothetical protein